MTEALTSGFRTTLENFTGPLDLLLYLIRKNEIDILDIPIADILAQYEEYVKFLRDIDVNAAADYLVMATTLMEIKSRMLLPQAPPEESGEELEDPREDLVRQLLEYRKYKERALALAARLEENARRFKRPVAAKDLRELDSLELGKVSVWDLVTAFLRVQKAIGADAPSEVVYTERPLSFYMELIQDTFTAKGADTVAFVDLFLDRGPIDRYTLIGIFLAVLELVRLGALGVDQNSEGEITVTRRMEDLTSCLDRPSLESESAAPEANGKGAEEPSGGGNGQSAEGRES